MGREDPIEFVQIYLHIFLVCECNVGIKSWQLFFPLHLAQCCHLPIYFFQNPYYSYIQENQSNITSIGIFPSFFMMLYGRTAFKEL